MKHKTAKANVKTKTRLFSLLLAVLMTLFCFPVTALGTDEAEEPISETLEETADAGLSAFERGVGELSPEALEKMTLNAADVPEVISAQAIAEKDHVLRLREQEENLNTVVFQNRDGGKTVYLYANPVKYVDANGNVKDKSTALKAENITLNGKTYSHSATENVFGQYYPTMPQNGVLITFGQYTVEMAPVITGILTLRDTAVANNKVTYNKVFGNGTSLVYTPTLSGVKEDIILQTYMGKSSFSFTLKTNGLAIVQTESDTFLADFEGNKVASLGKVVITDSANHTAYGSMTVTAKNEREEYTVTINAPTAFLTSTTTVYPVTVDPTVTIDETYTPDGYEDYSAIEDLCIYTGQETYYDDIATIGTYGSSSKAAMLYRISEGAWDYFGIYNCINGMVLYNAELVINTYSSISRANIVARQFNKTWNNGTTINVTESYMNCDFDASANITELSQISDEAPISINIKNVIKDWTDETKRTNGLILYVDNALIDNNPQNHFNVVQVEENSFDTYITFDWENVNSSFYINNKESGKFLKYSANSLSVDTHSSNGSELWSFRHISEKQFYIYPTNYPNYYLYADGDVLKIGTMTSNTNNAYKWTVIISETSGRIKNVGNGKFLSVENNAIVLKSAPIGKNETWRIAPEEYYIPLQRFVLQDYTNFIQLNKNESIIINLEKYAANTSKTPRLWCRSDDFIWESSSPEYVDFISNGVLKAGNMGATYINITITYKLTGQSVTIPVDILDSSEDCECVLPSTTRYNTRESAALAFAATLLAMNSDNEMGGYIYYMHGGYYLDSIQGSDVVADSYSIILTPPDLPDCAELVANIHTHLTHETGFEASIYSLEEYYSAVNAQVHMYVADICGCIFDLSPNAIDYTDYTVIRDNYSADDY